MLSELEKNLTDGIEKLIEKNFKPIDKMKPEEKNEVFFMVYKSLAIMLKRDFDVVSQLQVVEITFNKNEELKQNVVPDSKSTSTAYSNS